MNITHSNKSIKKILVAGATGYIGGRLVPRLLESGYTVRVLARDPRRLDGRPWLENVETVIGDVLLPETLPAAMAGVDAAYYLIHSMSDSDEFHERDILAARNFASTAKDSGVKRILYLGGLGDPQEDLSKHLRSRQLTGEALREAGVPVTELRAAVIVGSGSISFEMVRYLTERIPLMICPRWVFTRIQPIGIRDVLDYMLATLENDESTGKIIEIGGADVLTYGEMMLGYSEVRGLRRYLLPVPVLTPRLSSYWVHLVTPIPAAIARPLILGLRNEVVVRTDEARELFPEIKPIGYRESVQRALAKLESGKLETIWSDALVTSQGDMPPVYLTQEQGLIIERRQKLVAADPDEVFRVISGLGGDRGWLVYNNAWRLRGLFDRLVGGVGLRRGRRDPDELRAGDALDFWRVEVVEPMWLVRLRSEMKVPGNAWLQFESNPGPRGKTILAQTAYFEPKGLFGLLYWYVLFPIHAVIFSKMIEKIAETAEESLLIASDEETVGKEAQ